MLTPLLTMYLSFAISSLILTEGEITTVTDFSLFAILTILSSCAGNIMFLESAVTTKVTRLPSL